VIVVAYRICARLSLARPDIKASRVMPGQGGTG
jgi:hypothetical protein